MRGTVEPQGSNLDWIAEDLKGLAVEVEDLVSDPANARLHPERNMRALAASLRVYGQRKPVVVRREGMVVIAGNGTLEAARSLGWTHIAAVIVEDDALTATGYAIADNRTGELAEWDYEGLAKLLEELKDGDVDLELLGWLDHEVEPLLQAEWSPPEVDLDYDPTEEADKAAGRVVLQFTPEEADRFKKAVSGKGRVESAVLEALDA